MNSKEEVLRTLSRKDSKQRNRQECRGGRLCRGVNCREAARAESTIRVPKGKGVYSPLKCSQYEPQTISSFNVVPIAFVLLARAVK